MKPIQSLLALTVTASLVWGQQPAAQSQNDNNDDLQIFVIEGEDGANIVKDQTFAETIVEVRDKNNLPIAGGAAVTFAIVWAATHSGGGSPGTFGTGSNTLSVTADANGRAVMSGFRPQGTGQVEVQVQASFQGHTGKTTVHQTNFPTVAAAMAAGKNTGNQAKSNPSQNASNASSNATKAASHGMGTGAKVALVTLIAAGGAGGALYASGAFDNKSNSDTTDRCLALLDQDNSALQNYVICLSNNRNAGVNAVRTNCTTAFNNFVNAANQYCSCPTALASVKQTSLMTIQDWLNLVGGSVSTTCK